MVSGYADVHFIFLRNQRVHIYHRDIKYSVYTKYIINTKYSDLSMSAKNYILHRASQSCAAASIRSDQSDQSAPHRGEEASHLLQVHLLPVDAFEELMLLHLGGSACDRERAGHHVCGSSFNHRVAAFSTLPRSDKHTQT